MEKKNPLYTVSGNVKWYNQWKTLKTELLYDLAIPHPDICPKEWTSVSGRDFCTPVPVAALPATTWTQTQAKCPLTNKQLEKR